MAIKDDYPQPDKLVIKKETILEKQYYTKNEEKTYHVLDREISHRDKKKNRVSVILIINVLLLLAGLIIIRVLVNTDTAYKEHEGYIFVLRIVTEDTNKKVQLKVLNKNPESSLFGTKANVRFYIPEKNDMDVKTFIINANENKEILITSSLPVYAGDKVVSAEVSGADFSFTLVKKK